MFWCLDPLKLFPRPLKYILLSFTIAVSCHIYHWSCFLQPASWGVSDLESIIYGILSTTLAAWDSSASAVVLNTSLEEKCTCAENELWLMLHSVTTCNVLRRQTRQWRPELMLSNTARQRVWLKRLSLGDKRPRGFIDEILTSDSINALLLMDYSVLLPKATQRGVWGWNAGPWKWSVEGEMLSSEAGLSTKKMSTFISWELQCNCAIYWPKVI